MVNKLILILSCSLFLFSCDETTVFEKNIDIKGESWDMLDTLHLSTKIKDLEKKNVYVNLRHSTDFNWRNLWLTLSVTMPNDSTFNEAINLPLSQPNGQWYGKCASDICNIQIPIEEYNAYSFPDTGTYHFAISHEMRENPLPYILSAGIRIENYIAETK